MIALLLAATWLVGGFVVAVFMKRAGRDFRLWLLLGLLLGPFGGLFAPRTAPPTRAGARSIGEPKPGDLDVVAGIDGSAESVAAAQAAVRLLGDRISSLTLAQVLDYESAGPLTGHRAQESSLEALRGVSRELQFDPVDVELLYGPAGPTLASFADDRGFELIVVGARGHGLTQALFGSVANDLVGRSKTPVLVGARFATPDKPDVL